MAAYGGREITWPFRRTSNSMSRPQSVDSAEVGQQLGVQRRRPDPGVLQRRERKDPRGDRGGERLAEERAEWHGFPGLDVPGRPVINQAHAEHVLGEAVDVHRFAKDRLHADDEAELGLEVEPGRRAEGGPGSAGRPAGAVRAAHRGAGHDHRPGPAVIAGRLVPPVRGQRLAARPEYPADVAGVVLGRVEVDVIGDGEGQVQRGVGGGYHQVLECLAVFVVAEPVDDRPADLLPGAIAGGEELVEAARAHQIRAAGEQTVGGGRQIEHPVADRHPDARLGGPVPGGERAVGERLQSERVVRRDLEPFRRTSPSHQRLLTVRACRRPGLARSDVDATS